MPQYRINGGEPTDEQRRVLDETGDLLVVGRAGCGKTSIALLKALRFLNETTHEDAQVLFLSFSNAAVQRIQAAAKLIVPRAVARRLHLTTFHGFCFGVLASHARLVGMPRMGIVILPHEERIIRAESGGSAEALSTLERQQGRLPFDRFLPLTLALFRKHGQLRSAYARGYPLILVDEYQDTNDDQDELVDLLAAPGQLVYLGDPEQRVYDFVTGVRADRFEMLASRRQVTRIDLPIRSHRSGASDLVGYGRAVLAGRPLATKPQDVYVWRHGQAADFGKKLRLAIVTAEKAVRVRSGGKVTRPTTAVLAYSNGLAMRLSEELRSTAPGFEHSFAHRIHVDMPDLFPAWSLALAIMECPRDGDATEVVATAIHEHARFERSQDGQARQGRAKALFEAAEAFRKGTRVRARSLNGLPSRVAELAGAFSGEPRADMACVVAALGDVGGGYFDGAVRALNLRSPSDVGGTLVGQLAEAFSVHGCYCGAKLIGETFLARERLWETEAGTAGRLLTTLHKTKGKEFDAVVIVDGAGGADKLVLRDDPGLEKSRRLLSMAIARARYHVAIVTPIYDQCPLLPSHP